MLRLSEATPFLIQTRIDERERLEKAKVLAMREKCATDALDALYRGKSSFKDDKDREEINAYIGLP